MKLKELLLTENEMAIILYQLRKETTKGESRKHQQACKALQSKLSELIDK